MSDELRTRLIKAMTGVCRIIANHHSDRDLDTPEFRIVWDADWLVNIAGAFPDADADELHRIIEKTFKTDRGRALAEQAYL